MRLSGMTSGAGPYTSSGVRDCSAMGMDSHSAPHDSDGLGLVQVGNVQTYAATTRSIAIPTSKAPFDQGFSALFF